MIRYVLFRLYLLTIDIIKYDYYNKNIIKNFQNVKNKMLILRFLRKHPKCNKFYLIINFLFINLENKYNNFKNKEV